MTRLGELGWSRLILEAAHTAIARDPALRDIAARALDQGVRFDVYVTVKPQPAGHFPHVPAPSVESELDMGEGVFDRHRDPQRQHGPARREVTDRDRELLRSLRIASPDDDDDDVATPTG